MSGDWERDAQLIADVKAWRETPSVAADLEVVKTATLDLVELDALLRTIDRLTDDVSRLRRDFVDMPDDSTGSFKPLRVDALPPNLPTLGGDDAPLPPVA